MSFAKGALILWTLFMLYVLSNGWHDGANGANGALFLLTLVFWSIGTVPITLIGLLFKKEAKS